ncbi:MAG: DUF1449 domain-containing protein [Arenicella sp.]
MFAILLHKDLEPFYYNIGSFPTAIFTMLLVVCVLYWLVAVLGFIDLDVFDIDGLDAEGVDISDPTGVQNGIAGMLMKFGLNGVPFTIMFTFIVMIGWCVSYYLMHFLDPLIPGWVVARWVVGIPVLLGSLFVAVLLTAQLIKPIRKFFADADLEEKTPILGQKAVVRSTRVDKNFGEVLLADGGAGLLLKARATGDDVFQRGDVVIIFEHLAETNAYRVISEQEFVG